MFNVIVTRVANVLCRVKEEEEEEEEDYSYSMIL
jgi:hypothetical protein